MSILLQLYLLFIGASLPRQATNSQASTLTIYGLEEKMNMTVAVVWEPGDFSRQREMHVTVATPIRFWPHLQQKITVLIYKPNEKPCPIHEDCGMKIKQVHIFRQPFAKNTYVDVQTGTWDHQSSVVHTVLLGSENINTTKERNSGDGVPARIEYFTRHSRECTEHDFVVMDTQGFHLTYVLHDHKANFTKGYTDKRKQDDLGRETRYEENYIKDLIWKEEYEKENYINDHGRKEEYKEEKYIKDLSRKIGYEEENDIKDLSKKEEYEEKVYIDSIEGNVQELNTHMPHDDDVHRYKRQVQSQDAVAVFQATNGTTNASTEIVSIRCVSNCGSTVSPDTPVALEANVLSAQHIYPYVYDWFIIDQFGVTYDARDKYGLPDESVLGTPPYIMNLDPKGIEAGVRYTVLLEVSAPPCGCVHNATYDLATAFRPYDGSIIVEPPEGKSTDSFKISVVDVKDFYMDNYNQPLIYTIFYQDQLFNNSQDSHKVTLFHGQMNVLEMNLMPPGDKRLNDIGKIIVKVENQAKGVHILERNITVHPVLLPLGDSLEKINRLDNETKLVFIYSTVKQLDEKLDPDEIEGLVDLMDVPADSLSGASMKISAMEGLVKDFPPDAPLLDKYYEQLDDVNHYITTLKGEEYKDTIKLLSRQTLRSGADASAAVLFSNDRSNDIGVYRDQVFNLVYLSDAARMQIVDRSLSMVDAMSDMVTSVQQPFEAPFELDTNLMKVKIQSYNPEILAKEAIVNMQLSEIGGFDLPRMLTPEGQKINVQSHESKGNFFSKSGIEENSTVNDRVLSMSLKVGATEYSSLNDSTMQFTQGVGFHPDQNFTESGVETSILYNNIPVDVDSRIVFETFSVNVTPGSIALVVFSRELINQPVYVVTKLDEEPEVSDFVTSPGSNIADIEESFLQKSIWQWQFCTSSKKIIQPHFEKEQLIHAYDKVSPLNFYPFDRWEGREEELFINYTYITKVPLDFRTNKTANVKILEAHGMAHGVVLPWDRDQDGDVHHRSLSYINTDDNSHELFIGLLSHVDLMKDCEFLTEGYKQDESQDRYNMTFPITAKSLNCLFWNTTSHQWNGHGCKPSENTTLETLRCECTHLSSFTSELFVPPNKIHFSKELLQFQGFFTNPIAVVIVSVMWFIYILLMVWARRKDNEDVLKANVTVLMDNPPNGEYVYVLTVITGWLRGAGTTSVPTITLEGKRGCTYMHALFNPFSPYFDAGSEKSFLLTTKHSLGELTDLHVCTSLSGRSPTWFLRQITVLDVEHDEEYHFLCNKWFTPDSPSTIRRVLKPVELQEFSFGYRYSLTARRSMRNEHLWLSILTRPAYSTFTRKQRITCAFTYICITMLVSLMFFGLPPEDPMNQFKVFNVRLSKQDLMVSIQSAFITIPINTIVIMLFKNSRPKPISFEKQYGRTMKTLGKKERGDIEQAYGTKKPFEEVRGTQELEYIEETETDQISQDGMESRWRSSKHSKQESMEMKDIQKDQNGSKDKLSVRSVRITDVKPELKMHRPSFMERMLPRRTGPRPEKKRRKPDTTEGEPQVANLAAEAPRQPHRPSFMERMLPRRAGTRPEKKRRKPDTTKGEPHVANLAAEAPRQPHRPSFMERMLPRRAGPRLEEKGEPHVANLAAEAPRQPHRPSFTERILPGYIRARYTNRSAASTDSTRGPPPRDFRTRGPPSSDSRTRGPPSSDSRTRGPPSNDSRTRGPPSNDSRTRGPPPLLPGRSRDRQKDNEAREHTSRKAFLVHPERRRMTIRDSIVEGMKFINTNMSNINLWQDNFSYAYLMENNHEDILADSDFDSNALNMNMNNLIASHMNKQGDKKGEEAKSNEKLSARSTPGGWPHWCIYVGWLLSLAVAVVSSYFSMLYGLHYGYDTSLKWAIVFFGSFGQTACIIQPLRVFVITALICICLKTPIRPMVRYETIDIGEHLRRPQILEFPEDLDLLPEHIYRGPDHKRIHQVKRHAEKMRLLNQVFSDTAFYLGFVAITIAIAFGERAHNTFYINQSVRNCFIDGTHIPNSINFKQVRTTEDIWDFLLTTFIPGTQHPARYRQDFKSVIVDMSNVLVGVPRIRQVRKRTDCSQDHSKTIPVTKLVPFLWLDTRRRKCIGEEETGDFLGTWRWRNGTDKPITTTPSPLTTISLENYTFPDMYFETENGTDDRTDFNNTNGTRPLPGNDAGFEAYLLPDLTAAKVQEEWRRNDGQARQARVFAAGDLTSTAAPAQAFAGNATEPPHANTREPAHFTQKPREEVIHENLFNNSRWQPWIYNTPRHLQTPSFEGKFQTFSGGGYVQEFSIHGNVTLKLFKELRLKKWIDEETMALFVEFSVWNPALNVLSVVKLVFERTLLGDIIPHHTFIKTHQLTHHDTPQEIVMGIMRVTHAAFVFLYARHLLKQSMQHESLVNLIQFWLKTTKIEIVILTSAGFAWLFCIFKIFAEVTAKNMFIAQNSSGFLNWYNSVYYSEWYATCQGICVFTTTCNVLQLPLFFRFTHILGQTLIRLWKMTLAAVVCLAGLVMSGFIRFTDESLSFQSVLDTLMFILGLMVRELHYEGLVTNSSFEFHIMFYLSILICYIWMIIFPVVQMVLISVMSMYRRRKLHIELFLGDYFIARVQEAFGFAIKDETKFYREKIFSHGEL